MAIARIHIGTVREIENETRINFKIPEVCVDHRTPVDREALIIMGSLSIDSTVLRACLEENQIQFTERVPEPAHYHGDWWVIDFGHWFELDKAILSGEQSRGRLISVGQAAVRICDSELEDGAVLVVTRPKSRLLKIV